MPCSTCLLSLGTLSLRRCPPAWVQFRQQDHWMCHGFSQQEVEKECVKLFQTLRKSFFRVGISLTRTQMDISWPKKHRCKRECLASSLGILNNKELARSKEVFRVELGNRRKKEETGPQNREQAFRWGDKAKHRYRKARVFDRHQSLSHQQRGPRAMEIR